MVMGRNMSRAQWSAEVTKMVQEGAKLTDSEFAQVVDYLAKSGPAQPAEFEVATLKLSPPPEGDRININLGVALHGKVTLTNATLSDCIKFAYNLSSDVQLSGPDWVRMGPERFDVVGQAPAGTPREQLLVMLQKLLAERLHLRMHPEQRTLSFVALVVAKGGPKMKAVDAESPAGTAPNMPGRIVSPRMSMITLAKLLARFQRETVLDQTGLDGFYDVHLEYAPANATPDSEPLIGQSIYAALQQQLGLKLESRKGPVEVLVIDGADRTPAAN
jgi:uncharacterized protein (TIGR03435 family)